MPRILASLAALAFAVGLATAPVRAQTSSAPAMQTITGSGYQFQVPASWQALPTTMTQRMGGQTVTDDGAVASADGALRAHVETATGFGVTSARLVDILGAFLGIGQGGGQTEGPAPVAALTGPDQAKVSNSDSALGGSAVYMDPNGNSRVMAARIALRGDTTYILALDVTQDFYQSDPSYAAILNSLQLANP